MMRRGLKVVVVVAALVHLMAAQGFTSSCSGGVCVGGGSSAYSQNVDTNGVITGECAYSNSHGVQVKIRFRETPDGQINAQVVQGAVHDPVSELRVCRTKARETQKTTVRNAQQNFLHTQAQLQRQQQQLQDNILRVQQNVFGRQRFNFPPGFGFPNGFPFQNNYY